MIEVKLPTTRYYGSKRKLVKIIWEAINSCDLEFDSVLDLFGGTGIFSYYAKANSKQVIYNDVFKFNQLIGHALIASKKFDSTNEEVLNLLLPHAGINYKSIVKDNFKNIYFTDEENTIIDVAAQNIALISDNDKKAAAYYILFQSCIIKRPYNLFHRKNLHMRVNYTSGRFGNKITWERSFEELFIRFADELRKYTFDNNRANASVNNSALNCTIKADLVYIDPPYFSSSNSNHVSYHSRYHFLEGLANYNLLEANITSSKINKEIALGKSDEFDKKHFFLQELEALIDRNKESIIVISYRNNAYPSIEAIEALLRVYKTHTKCISLGKHSYALNKKNSENQEYIFIGY